MLSRLIQRVEIRPRQRGLTLIELAIALAVVGLVLGATLIPLRALDEVRQLQDEQRRLEVVRDAVVGYALRHQTRERTVKFRIWHQRGILGVSSQFRTDREFRLPAGRPYLPCPDWDGDGFEDRVPERADGFIQGMEAKPGLTATLGISSPGIVGYFMWESYDENGGLIYGSQRPYGECRVSRGAVPWRTLGIDPSDGWGNRHTYFVDQVFSSAIFGFDRQTIADIYDPRVPNALAFEASPRQSTIHPPEPSSFRRAVQHNCPAAICDGGRAGDCVTHEIENLPEDPSKECGWRSWDSLVLKAGAATKERIKIDNGRKVYPPGSVIDGLPFVLVSHGPNGRFAVNHWASLNRPVDTSGERSPICNFAWAERAVQESGRGLLRSRYEYYAVRPEERGLAHEMVNGVRHPPSSEGCPPVYRPALRGDGVPYPILSFFVWETPGLGALGPGQSENLGRLGFDDLLLWMTREELSLAVPGRIPPLPRMVVAYFP